VVITDGGMKKKPILLDLDGDGVEITELDRSTVYMDADGTGQKNRTAWAGQGDGVLFYDAVGSGTINDARGIRQCAGLVAGAHALHLRPHGRLTSGAGLLACL
jgi:hypothetical protein